jgi:hypothetical protein
MADPPQAPLGMADHLLFCFFIFCAYVAQSRPFILNERPKLRELQAWAATLKLGGNFLKNASILCVFFFFLIIK